MPDYKILETELGPMISHSRTSVYDVMLTLDKGNDIFFICVNHNLDFVQAQIALEYIAEHREELEADLREILPIKAAREKEHRAIQAEVERKIAQLPMTPERAELYRRLGRTPYQHANGSGEINDANRVER